MTSAASPGPPDLTVVATARNDDHGGNLLHRMQLFVNGLETQARRFGIRTELVLVEWNPPPHRPSLLHALDWPPLSDLFDVRLVDVPSELHATLDHAERLPLFQMIAKNVGIARSRGRLVLATNVDVIFSDELMRAIAGGLPPRSLFRADRHDVRAELDPAAPIDQTLNHCAANVIRLCKLEGTDDLVTGEHYPIYGPLTRLPGPLARWARLVRFGVPFAARLAARVPGYTLRCIRRRVRSKRGTASSFQGVPLRIRLAAIRAVVRERRAELEGRWELERARVRLHTNACGDFTLMSREDWFRLRGYTELQLFSMHLDSLLLYEAHYAGLMHVVLPGAVYHLEHEGGFKPDAEAVRRLAVRLEENAIPQITETQFLDWILEMFRRRSPLALNGESWGLLDHALAERRPSQRPAVSA